MSDLEERVNIYLTDPQSNSINFAVHAIAQQLSPVVTETLEDSDSPRTAFWADGEGIKRTVRLVGVIQRAMVGPYGDQYATNERDWQVCHPICRYMMLSASRDRC